MLLSCNISVVDRTEAGHESATVQSLIVQLQPVIFAQVLSFVEGFPVLLLLHFHALV